MSWITRIRNAAAGRRLRRELEEEQHFHTDARRAELEAAGRPPLEAAREARRRFGEPLRWREASQEVKSARWLADGLADARYALRMLRRRPGFALAAIASLGLALGAATAVFSLIDATLLRPQPYPAAQRIEFVWRIPPPAAHLGADKVQWGRLDFEQMAAAVAGPGRSFTALGAIQPATFALTGYGRPRRLNAVLASAGVFAALRVQPALGRVYTAAEDTPADGRYALLSDALWRSTFHADRGIAGRAVNLNGRLYTVLGVMPPGFQFPPAAIPANFGFARRADVWVPLALSPGPPIPFESQDLAIVGRLRARATLAAARSELRLYQAHEETVLHPRSKGWSHARLQSLPAMAAAGLRRPLLLLLLAVGVLLLIACSNVAGLLLARTLARREELALRAALGAGAGRLARQLVAECLVLALTGGAAGAALAAGAWALLRPELAAALPRLGAAAEDWRVFGFGLLATLASAALCALAPLALLHRTRAGGSGKGAVTTSAPPRMRGALAAAQLALALVLVVAGGLLARSLAAMLASGAGFNPDSAARARLTLAPARYPTPDAAAAFYAAVRRRVAAIPGVTAAGLAEDVPLDGAGEGTSVYFPSLPATLRRHPQVNYTMVTPGYFAAVGAPLLAGRAFRARDNAAAPPVAIVNAALARRFFPGRSAIGQQIHVPIDKLAKTIVGVVADMKHDRLSDTVEPEMYVPIAQHPWADLSAMELVVRARATPSGALPAGLRGAVVAAVAGVDPDVPVSNWRPLEALVNRSLAPPRLALDLLAGFALLALLLAAVGLYGVLAFAAAQRRREFGVRLALGATRASLQRLMLRHAAALAAWGIAAGWLLALLTAQLLSGFLYGVAPLDPLTLLLAPLVLAAVALVAAWLPARRAARLDPLTALREE
jgi:putative ABC transport system permease protein